MTPSFLVGAILAALTSFASTPAFAADPLPPPSLANDCGRTARVALNFIPGKQVLWQYPRKKLRVSLGDGLFGTMPVHEDVAAHIKVLVDKDGKPADVTVVGASAPQQFIDEYVGVLKTLTYEAPPPECRDKGVQLETHLFAMQADPPFVIFPDDPRYASAGLDRRKLVSGAVRIRYRNDIESAVIAASTGSPAADDAMVKIVSDTVRASLKDHPSPLTLEKIHFVSFAPEFIPPSLIKPASAAPSASPPPVSAPLPPPSLDNNCGRTAKVDLKAVPGTHLPPFMPQKTVVVPLGPQREIRLSIHDEGATRIRVVVGQDGKPADVSVEDSGAPDALSAALIGAIRARYRWEAPPPECARDGVVVHIDYIATEAPPDLLIYRDDPRFPAAARDRKMGGAGIAVVRYEAPDRIISTRLVTSTGSGALDNAMLKAVEGAALERLKRDPRSGEFTNMFHVMFMPDFLASPRQAAANPAIRAADRDLPPDPLPPLLDGPEAPSTANDCGRTHIATLNPILATHRPPPYPVQAQEKGEDGFVFLRILVDKDGVAQDATVVTSSGHAVLDDTIVNVVKGSWRWDKLPVECAARGAIIPLRFQYLYITGHPQQIFLDDPDYPDLGRAGRAGGLGSISYTVEKGKLTDIAVPYTSGSEEMDAAMMMWATHQPYRADYSGKTTRNIEFAPVASPFSIDVLMGPPAPHPNQ